MLISRAQPLKIEDEVIGFAPESCKTPKVIPPAATRLHSWRHRKVTLCLALPAREGAALFGILFFQIEDFF